MISGNSAWTTAINAQQKQPLYVFAIPGKNTSICSFFPLSLITGGSALLPVLQIPQGASQRIDELNGRSNISQLQINAIDPSGALKSLAADTSVIGQPCTLSMGFPGMNLSDFVTIHTGRIAKVGRSAVGVMNFQISDYLLNLVNDVFLSGGPGAWVSGQPTPAPPARPPAVAANPNPQPVSNQNPRYLSGNALDLLIAVMQNELGVGQSTAPVLVATSGGGSGTGQVGYGVNPLWRLYDGNDPTTILNPNPYYDVPGVITLRDTQFAGDRMEFTITGSTSGKDWIEQQLLRMCGLYWITGADGKLRLKSMKHPASLSPVAVTDRQIDGIPEWIQWPIINMVEFEIPATAQASSAGSSSFVTFANQTSLNIYQTRYVHQIKADGLRFGLGAYARMQLLANDIFRRHAYGTPEYTIKTFLKHFVLELGDFISLSHPLMLDLKTGTVGVSNVLCEIVDRQPNYANGNVTFKAIDTRFISTANGAFQIADQTAGIPSWGSASPTQKSTYMYVSDRSGLMSDSTAANQIQ